MTAVYSLVVIVFLIGGGIDGGAHTSTIEVSGKFSRAECEAAKSQIEQSGATHIWNNGMVRGGISKISAYCIKRG